MAPQIITDIWRLERAANDPAHSVYALTPRDRPSHLDSSMEGFLMHLWPPALLLAGLATKPRTE
jgi:hypothetical protein